MDDPKYPECPSCQAEEGLAILEALSRGEDVGKTYVQNGKSVERSECLGHALGFLTIIARSTGALCKRHRAARKPRHTEVKCHLCGASSLLGGQSALRKVRGTSRVVWLCPKHVTQEVPEGVGPLVSPFTDDNHKCYLCGVSTTLDGGKSVLHNKPGRTPRVVWLCTKHATTDETESNV